MFEYLYSKNFKKYEKKYPEPIRIFIGSTPAQDLVVKVLDWSIKKNTQFEYEIIPMHLNPIDIPMPKDTENKPGTPFSFQRFTIPELCNFTGKAIYIDSDQLLTDDIGKLFHRPVKAPISFCHTEKQGKKMQRASVLLIDCSQVKTTIKDIVKDLDDKKYNYKQLMTKCPFVKKLGRLHNKWNSLDRYYPNKTSLIHYTEKETQPWLNTSHQDVCSDIWFQYLFDAVKNDFINVDEIYSAIASGFIRPSIKYQFENKITKVKDLPLDIKELDVEFLKFCRKYKFNSVPGDYRN